MEISQEDRLKMLQEIKLEIGLVERDDDEFTAKELCLGFSVSEGNLFRMFDDNEIKYTRRKAVADGRRQFVYKLIKEAL